MTNYKKRTSKDFDKDMCKLKSNFVLQKRVIKKIVEILENPSKYKNLRNVLKNRQRVHVGSFVLIFEVNEADKVVIFHSFKHHDRAYK